MRSNGRILNERHNYRVRSLWINIEGFGEPPAIRPSQGGVGAKFPEQQVELSAVSNERLLQPPHQRPIFKDIVCRSVETAAGGRSLQQTVANQAGQSARIKVGGGNKRLQSLRPAQRDFHQHLSTQIGQTALHIFVNTASHLAPDLLSKRTFGGRQWFCDQPVHLRGLIQEKRIPK